MKEEEEEEEEEGSEKMGGGTARGGGGKGAHVDAGVSDNVGISDMSSLIASVFVDWSLRTARRSIVHSQRFFLNLREKKSAFNCLVRTPQHPSGSCTTVVAFAAAMLCECFRTSLFRLDPAKREREREMSCRLVNIREGERKKTYWVSFR